MPKKLEEKLKHEVETNTKYKNLPDWKKNAIIYGIMRKTGWSPKREKASAQTVVVDDPNSKYTTHDFDKAVQKAMADGYDQKQLLKGYRIEKQNHTIPRLALDTAIQNLESNPNYYKGKKFEKKYEVASKAAKTKGFMGDMMSDMADLTFNIDGDISKGQKELLAKFYQRIP